MPPQPTIRGIFMKSHVQAVAQKKGDPGLKELEKMYGGPTQFKNSDEVPIREEVKLLECAVQILSDCPIPKENISYEAGRLHFKDFSSTPLGKLVLPFFKNNYKMILLRAKYLGGHVFRGVTFLSDELGPNAVQLTMSNADYPIDHFRGLFEAWMEYCGLCGTIQAIEPMERVHQYVISWQPNG
jgi:uncharacterized protein (TIGR02265 family)